MRPLSLLLGSILAAALVGACFSERVGGSSSTITPGVDCNVPLSVIDSGNVVVAIHHFAFQHDSILIRPGRTVTWVNCESAGTEGHTTTADQAAWDSPTLQSGERFSFTFTTGGTYPYHCKPHPFMVGKVIVSITP